MAKHFFASTERVFAHQSIYHPDGEQSKTIVFACRNSSCSSFGELFLAGAEYQCSTVDPRQNERKAFFISQPISYLRREPRKKTRSSMKAANHHSFRFHQKPKTTTSTLFQGVRYATHPAQRRYSPQFQLPIKNYGLYCRADERFMVRIAHIIQTQGMVPFLLTVRSTVEVHTKPNASLLVKREISVH